MEELPYIQSAIIDNDPQPPVLALGIIETWLTESVSEAQSELKGFQCIRSDRDSRKGEDVYFIFTARLYHLTRFPSATTVTIWLLCNCMLSLYTQSLLLCTDHLTLRTVILATVWTSCRK